MDGEKVSQKIWSGKTLIWMPPTQSGECYVHLCIMTLWHNATTVLFTQVWGLYYQTIGHSQVLDIPRHSGSGPQTLRRIDATDTNLSLDGYQLLIAVDWIFVYSSKSIGHQCEWLIEWVKLIWRRRYIVTAASSNRFNFNSSTSSVLGRRGVRSSRRQTNWATI